VTSIRQALDASRLEVEDDAHVRLDVEEAIRHIFADPGQKLVFVFNQNLRRTNLQAVELVSLVQLHTRYKGANRPIDGLEFSTFAETQEFVAEALQGTQRDKPETYEVFCKEIETYLHNKVLLELYYGSACVFIPPHMEIDLALICGESGYIHSCGYLLFLRNSSKATEEEFKHAFAEGISLRKKGECFLFVPYCHEDFSGADRYSTPFLEFGLDDIKVNMSKAYVGSKRLHEIIDEIELEYEDIALVAPTDYRASREEFYGRFPGKAINTIWVISESSHGLPSRFPAEKRFYVVYLQEYKNDSVYHLYDENKPGWASHTTLPHSMTGALVNIARPSLPIDGPIMIGDPFCGSGTMLFEVQKFSQLGCTIADRAPIFRYIVKDNVQFFQQEKPSLLSLYRELERFKSVVPEENASGVKKESRDGKLFRIKQAVSIALKACSGDFLKLGTSDVDALFESVGPALLDRLLMYLVLRVSVRGTTALARQNETWTALFSRELEAFVRQIHNHCSTMPDDAVPLPQNDRLQIGSSHYSKGVSQAPPLEVADIFSTVRFHIDGVDKLAEGKFDAIITDPPYGFNTDESYWETATFVEEMVPFLVNALKPSGGQIILAAPQESYSGRTIIPFVRSSVIGRRIIRYCKETERECVSAVSMVPRDMGTVRAPYYWTAEKTLQRKILHFRIRGPLGLQ